MSYVMGRIVLGLLMAWLFGFFIGLLWKFIVDTLNAAIGKESE